MKKKCNRDLSQIHDELPSDKEYSLYHIDCLNEDCLFHIFSFLSIKELLKIERVCKRWRNASLRLFHIRSKHLDLKNDFKSISFFAYDLSFIEGLLQKTGKFVTNLDLSQIRFYCSFQELFEAIDKNCEKLSHLNISIIRTSSPNNNGLILPPTMARRLISLKMNNCQVNNEAFAAFLKTATNLEELHIESVRINGKCLMNLSSKIEILNVNGCSIPNGNLKEILKRLPNIKVLGVGDTYTSARSLCDISNQLVAIDATRANSFFTDTDFMWFGSLKKLNLCDNKSVQDDAIVHLTEKAPNIAHLYLTNCFNVTGRGFRALENFRHLTTLDLGATYITNDMLIYLASSLQKIEEFSCSKCEYLTEGGFQFLIDHLTNLRTLHLKFLRISAQFLKRAFETVQHREGNPPLTIYVTFHLIKGFEIVQSVEISNQLWSDREVEIGPFFCLKEKYYV